MDAERQWEEVYRQAADAGAGMGLTAVYLLFHAPTSGKRERQPGRTAARAAFL